MSPSNNSHLSRSSAALGVSLDPEDTPARSRWPFAVAVKVYRVQMMMKLGVRSTAELQALAEQVRNLPRGYKCMAD